jgi:hypothetical protein
MPRVGFEPTITVLARTKTVHALDRATTAIGLHLIFEPKSIRVYTALGYE